ncbi:fibronectin type III domain-containing protein [Actinomadura macrotermitis]|uniref:Fibronectin type-III domain-containing protein n=1 Tax=Actinomadura macrotermitis TaxID=2585200 RepID=A0A7K0C801_9ACTN|nr:fibronectin type III domain-containing protein [Actinomadura macrotermitis]MQY09577.1 hypothetical protein [Actinomadura macrotermitis]
MGVRGLLRRDRLSGQITIGLVGVLLVSALVYGVGMASATYRVSDVGAWLSATARGMVVHANGLAGRVDGKTSVPQSRGHRIKIVQNGRDVLLVDEATGVVSRIDPAQLQVEQTRRLGVGLQVVLGAGTAYAVDRRGGTVQRIDPVSLAGVGAPVTLAPPLDRAGLDARGTLWVPVPASGQLVPVSNGAKGRPVQVGGGGGGLQLSIVAGTPVAVDPAAAVATIIRPGGVQKVALPPAIRDAGPGGVRLPAAAESLTVPLLGARDSLTLLDTGTGAVTSVGLRMPRHRFGEPQVLGPKVYIPDETAGSLIVYNYATRRAEQQVPVSGRPGPLDVFVKDGLLWANDPGGEAAVSLDSSGAAKHIRKYEDKVAGGTRKQLPNPETGRTGGTSPDDRRKGGDRRRRRDGLPSAASSVVARGENNTITVTFQPSVPGKVQPAGYVLQTADGAAVGNAAPGEVKPGQEYKFTVSGLECSKVYSYRVVVRYQDPRTRRMKNGPPSDAANATACELPGAPKNVAASGAGGKVTVTFEEGDNPQVVQQYLLTDGSGKAVAGVAPLPRDGAKQFVVTGLKCTTTEYTFGVTALYQDGGATKKAPSGNFANARPCIAPGPPGNVTADPANHGGTITWTKSTGDGISYHVSWEVGTDDVKTLSYSLNKLTNGRTYQIRVSAQNGAGSQSAGTVLNLDPALHAVNYNGHNNNSTSTFLHTAAGLNTPRSGSFPKGFTGQVKVICQVTNDMVTDANDPNLKSNVWDQIEYNGGRHWVSDLYVTTPGSNSGQLSESKVWGCQ